MGDKMELNWEVRIVDKACKTQYSKLFRSFEMALSLYREMRCVLYNNERVAIVPVRINEHER